jgi:UDP-N-acetylglucosamine 2-epimerase (non-hydrolysing)
MKKILVVFGTRPEVIKLAPVIKELKKSRKLRVITCSTGQHNEMIKQVNSLFGIKIDYDLKLMKENQNLFDLTAGALKKIKGLLAKVKPELLIVQGDTTTAFAASLAAFYMKIKVAHVEAGLRSKNIYSPFPEELNRKIISLISGIHFTPTKSSRNNLLNEGTGADQIYVTGNTVIDAVSDVKKRLEKNVFPPSLKTNNKSETWQKFINTDYILITIHRREKFGEDLRKILLTLKELAEENRKYNFVYPVHLNPNVKNNAERILKNVENFHLLPPVDYVSFLYLMKQCRFIISDSGGVQEECYVFRKPVIVIRKDTERNEAIDAGYAFLAGHTPEKIKKLFYSVDSKISKGNNFFKSKNPFGDGKAAQRIVKIIQKQFGL